MGYLSRPILLGLCSERRAKAGLVMGTCVLREGVAILRSA
jgi:hypothetical protein